MIKSCGGRAVGKFFDRLKASSLPVIHNLKRRNVAGNLPNCGSKDMKRVEQRRFSCFSTAIQSVIMELTLRTCPRNCQIVLQKIVAILQNPF